MIMGNLDESIKRLLQSGKHSSASLEKDLHELVKRAIESKIFTKQEGRSYKEFSMCHVPCAVVFKSLITSDL